MTIGFILTPDRAARLVAQKAVDPTLPGLPDVVNRLVTHGLRRGDDDAVRSGDQARDGARARDPADDARRVVADEAGPRARVGEPASALERAALRGRRDGRCPSKPARIARSSPTTSSASSNGRWISAGRPRRPPRLRARRSATSGLDYLLGLDGCWLGREVKEHPRPRGTLTRPRSTEALRSTAPPAVHGRSRSTRSAWLESTTRQSEGSCTSASVPVHFAVLGPVSGLLVLPALASYFGASSDPRRSAATGSILIARRAGMRQAASAAASTSAVLRRLR